MISKILCTRADQLMTSLAMNLARTARAAVPMAALIVLTLSPLQEQAQAQTQNAPASLQVVLLIDRSASVQSKDVSMPRVRFARILVDALRAQSWVSGAEIDLAIADFGGTVQLRRPMTRLGNEEIEIPLDLAASIPLTDFRTPLREARGLFTPGGDPKRIVIVLTDGIPQLEKKFSLAKSTMPIPVYFGASESAPSDSVRAALSALSAIGAETFLVVDDANDDSTRVYSPAWKKILPPSHYLSLGQPGPRFTAARTLFDAIGGGRVEFQRIIPGRPFALTLSKRYRALGILAIQPSPEARFEVSSPEGERLPFAFGSPEDRYAFYFDLSPSPGKWLLSTVGEASEFYVWVGREVQVGAVQPAVSASSDRSAQVVSWPLLLLTTAGFGLVMLAGFWARRKLLEREDRIAQLDDKLSQVEEEREKLRVENSELRDENPNLIREAQNKRESARKALKEGKVQRAEELFQESLSLTLDFAEQAASLAVSKASEIYDDIHKGLYRDEPERQWALIGSLISDRLSREGVHVIAQILRQRWQMNPALFLDEFYDLQLWSRGDWLVEELSSYSPSIAAESKFYSNGSLLRQIAEQRKRLNGLVGDI